MRTLIVFLKWAIFLGLKDEPRVLQETVLVILNNINYIENIALLTIVSILFLLYYFIFQTIFGDGKMVHPSPSIPLVYCSNHTLTLTGWGFSVGPTTLPSEKNLVQLIQQASD